MEVIIEYTRTRVVDEEIEVEGKDTNSLWVIKKGTAKFVSFYRIKIKR